MNGSPTDPRKLAPGLGELTSGQVRVLDALLRGKRADWARRRFGDRNRGAAGKRPALGDPASRRIPIRMGGF
jgi:hypothetical protein